MPSKKPDLSYIHAQLRRLAVPTESLHLDPKNARKHSDENIESIRNSLEMFGQRLPIVVQKSGMVVRAGNGRLVAARMLKWEHIAAIVTDDEDAMAIAFAIADNRSAELGEWDYEQLGEVLQPLVSKPEELGFDPQKLGFSAEELEAIANPDPWEGLPDEQVQHASTVLIKIRVRDVEKRKEVADALRELVEERFEGVAEFVSG